MLALQMSIAAVIFLLIGGGMAYYDWLRVRAGRPIFGGHIVIQFYWVTYLSMFALAILCAVTALIR
jgi:hypothetical protein